MLVGRIIGWLFLLLALGAFAFEVAGLVQTGTWEIRALGSLWFDLHKNSLGAAQVVVQRYVWAPIWDPFVITLLQWPGWFVFGVPGIVLAYVFRRGRQRRWFIDN
jgi:hypothetical protein